VVSNLVAVVHSENSDTQRSLKVITNNTKVCVIMSFFPGLLISVASWFIVYGLFERFVRYVVISKKRLLMPDVMKDVWFHPTALKASILSRYVASFHAGLTALVAMCYLLGFLPYDTWCNLQVIPIGYCVYDTLMYFGKYDIYRTGDSAMPIHHFVFAVFAFFVTPSYPWEVAVSYLAETSTPWLHLSYTMIHNKSKDTHPLLFRVAVYTTLTLFLTFRVVGLGYMWYTAIHNREIVLWIMLSFMWGINTLWFFKLTNKANQL